jgi:hypothetical protein
LPKGDAERLGNHEWPCHERAMAPHPRSSRSGGSLLAIAIIVGAVAGTVAGQPSIGFMTGLGAGLLLLGLVYYMDRRRGR